jgi:hypothetical protein
MKVDLRLYTGNYEYVAREIMAIRSFINLVTLIGVTLIFSAACARNNEACVRGEGVTLQILGSGGPIADDARASSGYLVWADGKSRVLIDAGGGTFLRFGEAGASFAELAGPLGRFSGPAQIRELRGSRQAAARRRA